MFVKSRKHLLQAGMGAWAYQSWSDKLAPEVQVIGIVSWRNLHHAHLNPPRRLITSSDLEQTCSCQAQQHSVSHVLSSAVFSASSVIRLD